MLTLNLDNIDVARLGPDQGLRWKDELRAHAEQLERAAAELESRRSDPQSFLGWMDVISDSQLTASVKELAGRVSPAIDDLVVLGIGGSSLGGLTVVTALQHPYHQLLRSRPAPRVHFVDNVDGDVLLGLMEVLDPARTAINVISKSGTTTETMSAYLLFKDWLSRALGDAYRSHVVATTDPVHGILRPLSSKEGFATLPVPANIGGRYSVLCPVGLFPAAVAGVDIDALLAGAREAQASFGAKAAENPVLQAALVHLLYAKRGKNICVFMPYSTRLRYLSDWFAQLWAESLGKEVDRLGSVVHSGTTPVKALGTTDQHSQVQLYREGPLDKLTVFVRVEKEGRPAPIPNAEPDQPDMNYLAGRRMQELMNAELAATAHALAEARRPSYTMHLPAIDARALGYILQFLMLQTAVVGEVLGIDTFNQPGVELGKVLTYALMGRPGYETQLAELRQAGVKP